MVLDASLLNTQHYKVRIKGKVEQSREGVAPSPTHWCSSYRKGSLRVTLDYGRQLYFTIILTHNSTRGTRIPSLDLMLVFTLSNLTIVIKKNVAEPSCNIQNRILRSLKGHDKKNRK